MAIPYDIQKLPARMTTAEVLELARYGRATLRAKQKAGTMPMHVDRGGEGLIFNRDEVLRALGLLGTPEATKLESDPWDFDPEAFNKAMAELRAERALARKAASAQSKPKAKLPRGPLPTPKSARDLGRYVVMKPRSDGRCAIYFQVPKKLRPAGWRPTINLPLNEPRTGDMKNREEVARIRNDARELHLSLTRERAAQNRQAVAAALEMAARSKKPDAE